jgi:transcription antitermination factor NusG
MSKAWYVINSYSGYENKAKEQLLERIKWKKWKIIWKNRNTSS